MNDNKHGAQIARETQEELGALVNDMMVNGHRPIAIAFAMLNKAYHLIRSEGFPRMMTRHMVTTHLIDAEALDTECNGSTASEFFRFNAHGRDPFRPKGDAA